MLVNLTFLKRIQKLRWRAEFVSEILLKAGNFGGTACQKDTINPFFSGSGFEEIEGPLNIYRKVFSHTLNDGGCGRRIGAVGGDRPFFRFSAFSRLRLSSLWMVSV